MPKGYRGVTKPKRKSFVMSILLAARLEDMAARTKRTVTSILTEALEEYLNNYDGLREIPDMAEREPIRKART